MDIMCTTNVNKLLTIIMLILSGGVIYIADSPDVQVVTFVIQFLLTIVLGKVDFASPRMWFLGGVTVYSIGYPLLYMIEFESGVAFTPEPLQWSWLAYFVFVIFFSEKKNIKRFRKKYVNDKTFVKYFFYVSGVFVLGSLIPIILGGYTDKGEIYNDGNIYISLAFWIIYAVHTIYVWLMQINYQNDKKNRYIILYIGIISLLMTMFSGERDILFRFILITIFSMYINKSITPKMLGICFAGLIGLIPLSRMLKYYFLSSDLIATDFYESPYMLIIGIIGGEFESASKNLQILANDSDNSMGEFMGGTYISDITRIFGYSPYSAISWFNERYYPGSIVGHGFTIIGEGYINFGILGIILNFVIIAVLLSYLYNNRFKSEVYTTIYICIIPTMIYVMRADFSNLISPLVKQVLIPLLLVRFVLKNKRVVS